MITIRIKNIEDKWFNDFYALYSNAFPDHEKHSYERQIEILKSDNYHLHCFSTKTGKFIGFIGYWDFGTYIYIEHYAINSKLRGEGYGSVILKKFTNRSSKPIILEIDLPIDKTSIKRLKFYKNLGFVRNKYEHIHPPYNGEGKDHTLLVLSTPTKISQSQYDMFYDDFLNIING